jgi:hypothetical protein
LKGKPAIFVLAQSGRYHQKKGIRLRLSRESVAQRAQVKKS